MASPAQKAFADKGAPHADQAPSAKVQRKARKGRKPKAETSSNG